MSQLSAGDMGPLIQHPPSIAAKIAAVIVFVVSLLLLGFH